MTKHDYKGVEFDIFNQTIKAMLQAAQKGK